MTGPEHYKEAERILDEIKEHASSLHPDQVSNGYEQAQVHATLALAAATAERNLDHCGYDLSTADGWEEATQ